MDILLFKGSTSKFTWFLLQPLLYNPTLHLHQVRPAAMLFQPEMVHAQKHVTSHPDIHSLSFAIHPKVAHPQKDQLICEERLTSHMWPVSSSISSRVSMPYFEGLCTAFFQCHFFLINEGLVSVRQHQDIGRRLYKPWPADLCFNILILPSYSIAQRMSWRASLAIRLNSSLAPRWVRKAWIPLFGVFVSCPSLIWMANRPSIPKWVRNWCSLNLFKSRQCNSVSWSEHLIILWNMPSVSVILLFESVFLVFFKLMHPGLISSPYVTMMPNSIRAANKSECFWITNPWSDLLACMFQAPLLWHHRAGPWPPEQKVEMWLGCL